MAWHVSKVRMQIQSLADILIPWRICLALLGGTRSSAWEYVWEAGLVGYLSVEYLASHPPAGSPCRPTQAVKRRVVEVISSICIKKKRSARLQYNKGGFVTLELIDL